MIVFYPNSEFVGTLQYGNFVVRVLNKEDFVGTTPINI